MSPHDTALRLAIIKVLSDLLKDARASAASEARQALMEGDRITAQIGGAKLAAVTLTTGSTRVKVSDEQALAAWVEKHHPSEVDTSPRVRPAFVKHLQEQARTMGAPVDPATGEIIPGLEITTGQPYPSVRATAEARQILARAWRSGDLPLDSVLHLEEAPGE